MMFNHLLLPNLSLYFIIFRVVFFYMIANNFKYYAI